MATFVIEGEQSLHGTIPVQGSKNNTYGALAACLLTDEVCEIHRVPKIADVLTLLEIFSAMGVLVKWEGETTVKIDASTITPEKIPHALVQQIRMSVVLLGALLARCGSVTMPFPGGDKIGARPLDAHTSAFRALGAEVHLDATISVQSPAGGMVGARVVMQEMSVTGTVNAIFAALAAKGKTRLVAVAVEPHITNLVMMLQSMGADIAWVNHHALEITGGNKLHGTVHEIDPDYLEMGTFVNLAAATRSELHITPFVPDFLPTEMAKWAEMGVVLDVVDGGVTVKKSSHLVAPTSRIHSMPYPGLSADNLHVFAVLATQAEGTTLLHDWMYEGRQRYLSELITMGADAHILDPHRSVIHGPTPLYGKEVVSYDIRAGATLVIAALLAQGTTTLHHIEQIDRGYVALDERLRNIGASIIRKD